MHGASLRLSGARLLTVLARSCRDGLRERACRTAISRFSPSRSGKRASAYAPYRLNGGQACVGDRCAGVVASSTS